MKLHYSDKDRLSRHHVQQFDSLLDYISDLAKQEVARPEIGTKLANMVAGILTTKEKPAVVAFIAHINTLQKNYEETLNTLQYQQRI